MSSRTRRWLSTAGIVLLAAIGFWLQSSDDSTDVTANPETTASTTLETTTAPTADAPGSTERTENSTEPAVGDPTGTTETTDDAGVDGTSSSSTSALDRPDPTPAPPVTFSSLPKISPDELPEEALTVLELIEEGGPFPYDKDGSTFGNFEGILPDRQRGHYSEYTVDTPGLNHRGARRIVAGGDGERYWTADHYESFEEIVER